MWSGLSPKNGRVGIALATFVFGVVLGPAASTIIRLWGLPAVEKSPCRSCSLLYRQEIPLVSVCDLNRNFEQYRGQLVRVRGFLAHDAGQITLIDEGSCALHSGFANRGEGCNGSFEALFVYTGWGSWYDSAAQVTVVGHVGPLENPTLYADDRGFNIDCLESVEPLGTGLKERIKYTLGGLFRRVFN